MDPITVNAMYGSDVNALNIPAANFQSPLFTPQIPDETYKWQDEKDPWDPGCHKKSYDPRRVSGFSNVNYGVAGVVLGHEIGHGFDDTGIMYGNDGDGTRLSHSILKNYYQRAECFIHQFDEYYGHTEAPGTTESMEYVEPKESERTRGENMADSTGIQAVFQAYKKLKKPKRTVRLEGLEEFTDDQLFFISFAASWCEVGTPKYEEKQKKSKDEHSPPKLRVLGSVSNTEGFAQAFNCPLDSPMNPADKCSVWGNLKKQPDTRPAWMRRKPSRWGQQWRG